ncbi:SDR family NAD(P)-dependent oxidoreductase [Fictibacillus nanhaiensis]|uniref:SDR family NAD(P)-dependent oxidoreductase n=1 Tax=Fictibacillus nanhaiensis TaxID=742169 RepID=UPI003C13B08E
MNLRNLSLDHLTDQKEINAGIKINKMRNAQKNSEIAIIGFASQFSSSEDNIEFWEIIQNGIDCTSPFPLKRKEAIDAYLKLKNEKEYSYLASSYMSQVDEFDYNLFRISPTEASLMSPLQRLFMQNALTAIEDAGYGGDRLAGTNTGIYLGLIGDLEAFKYREMIESVDSNSLPIAASGNLASMIPARISYFLNLKGPTMLIDTACSSSLVAVDTACRAIRTGNCEMAIAGGIHLSLIPLDNRDHKIGIESLDAFTRSFDDHATGSGLGEGVGCVILKPLDKALEDGDNIHAVIKGSASNQDGTSMGITAPNPSSQEKVLLKAWKEADISPETLDYIEVHGSGTKLGDGIELEGISNAFNRHTSKKQFCAISSVKSNIGHLYDAAGIAGLIKAILSLKEKKLPPSINFKTPNRTINFEESPVYVNTKLRVWEEGETPRRCGVSSFGISGTNCHVVLEEAPVRESEEANEPVIMTISARSTEQLNELIIRYIQFCQTSPFNYEDFCYTANTGRTHHKFRLSFIVSSKSDLVEKLLILNDRNFNESASGAEFYFFNEAKQVPDKSIEILQRNEVRSLLKQTHNIESLTKVCMKYVEGNAIPWDLIYRKRPVKISIPTYPFLKKSNWIKLPQDYGLNTSFYSGEWKLSDSIDRTHNPYRKTLVLTDEGGIARSICEELRVIGRDVYEIEFGQSYEEISPNKTIISGVLEDYERLIERIGPIDQVIHLSMLGIQGDIEDINDLNKSQIRGLKSLFYLVKALENFGECKTNFSIITNHSMTVTGEEKIIKPENASISGLGRVINKEFPNFYCRMIDFDGQVSIKVLFGEIESNSNYNHVAYRKEKRYVQEFKEVRLGKVEKDSEKIYKDNGVYLITGGLGDLGFEFAKIIASNTKAKLVMVNRSLIPDRSMWREISQDDGRQLEYIRKIKLLEQLGSEVLICQADISNFQMMSNVIDLVKNKYGKIDGIIHAAGVGTSVEIKDQTNEDFDSVISAKIHGTWILDELTKDQNLDFFVLFSSIASWFPAPGQGDYCAANRYMDSFSEFRNKKGKRTISINWSTWKETGMAKANQFNIDTLFKTLTTQEAIDGFHSVINSGLSSVLIGTINYDWPLISSLETGDFDLSSDIKEKMDSRRKGIKLPKKSEQGIGKKFISNDVENVEETLLNIVSDVLGFQELDIYDSFFELGADSILIKQIHTRLESLYPDSVTVADFFEHPSIHKLSKFIQKQDQKDSPKEPSSSQPIDDQLDEILNRMSDSEISIDDVVSSIAKL